jgi:hypothetical protein
VILELSYTCESSQKLFEKTSHAEALALSNSYKSESRYCALEFLKFHLGD